MDFLKLEDASFRSWPAIEKTETDGIVLRFSNGFTKRANSANVLVKKRRGFESVVRHYERYFQAKKLPCIFRLPSFAGNEDFDSYLENRGYRLQDKSLVLAKSIEELKFEGIRFPKMSKYDWISTYCNISDVQPETHLSHLEIINRIADKTLLAVVKENGNDVACGLGVISNGLFGLFDIQTRQSLRHKGYATKLINGMLCWAQENGAQVSYLQVVADNTPARNLYEKLGYQVCYEYWYRIRDLVKI